MIQPGEEYSLHPIEHIRPTLRVPDEAPRQGSGVVNSAAGVGSRGGTVESAWAFVPATQASRAGIEDFQSSALLQVAA